MDWLSDFVNLSTSLYKIAQATPPTAAPTANELELVKQQMAFLQEANKTLAASFDRYVKMVQLTLATAGGIVGVIAVLGDLHHAGIDQDQEKANAVIKAVGAKVPAEQAALIIYGNARFYEEIPKLAANGKYCGASNGP